MTPQEGVPLAPLCTMRVGGPARWFVHARNESEIVAALAWADQRGVTVDVLGGGSNVVISDDGVDGLVIHVEIRDLERVADAGHVTFTAGAGAPWDPFVAMTVSENAAGLECLSGIPGYVGGTPVQNVGAYGQDVSGTITRVRVIDRQTRAGTWFSNAECGFGYRTSRFKREDTNRYVVIATEFRLTPDGPPTVAYADLVTFLRETDNFTPSLKQVRQAILAIRRRKGMVIEEGNAANRSCGSFFVNPIVTRRQLQHVREVAAVQMVPHYEVNAESVKIPAAWLIERAGFPKGTTVGTVGVSPFQAQAIINLGSAEAIDIVALACDIKHAVWNTFRISIVPEPVFLGFRDSPELRFLLTHQRSH